MAYTCLAVLLSRRRDTNVVSDLRRVKKNMVGKVLDPNAFTRTHQTSMHLLVIAFPIDRAKYIKQNTQDCHAVTVWW